MSDTRKEMILAALDAFVRQRSGIDYRNYYQSWADTDGVRAYRQEARSITRDLRDYRDLRRTVELRDSITADDLLAAFRDAYSGRLSITFEICMKCEGSGAIAHPSGHPGNLEMGCPVCHGANVYPKLDYCTGQYFPTEYRKAACAVLALALWARKRGDMPPKLDGTELYSGFVNGEKSPTAMSAGDWLRTSFRRDFGRGIASRWFS